MLYFENISEILAFIEETPQNKYEHNVESTYIIVAEDLNKSFSKQDPIFHGLKSESCNQHGQTDLLFVVQ